MKRSAILGGLKDRLIAAGLSVGYVFPNVKPQSDYRDGNWLDVSISVTDRIKRGVSTGTKRIETGRFNVIVVTKTNGGEAEGADLADLVTDQFPKGQKISVTGGQIEIDREPVIRGGFQDGDEWRTPVTIFYTASSTG